MTRLSACALVALVCCSLRAEAQVRCTSDSACGDGGVCFFHLGCDAGAGVCTVPAWLPPGDYCGCDGRTFSRNRDGTGDPMRPWSAPGACGADAGPPPALTHWFERSWARNFTDAGVRLTPKLALAPTAPSVVGNFACEGKTARLTLPREQRFPAADAGYRVYLGCDQELPVTTWSANAIDVRVPPGARSGCVWLGAPGSLDDAALQRTLCAPRKAMLALREQSERPVELRCREQCVDRCVTGPDGGVLNRLEVGRPPALDLSAFAALGPPSALRDGGLRLVVPEGTAALVSWRTDGGVKLRSPGGLFRDALRTESLERAGTHSLEATNACGTSRQSLLLSRKKAVELPQRLLLKRGAPGRVTVKLPEPARERIELPVRLEGRGVRARTPTVVLEPGQSEATVELDWDQSADAGVRMARLLVTAPAGYDAPEPVELVSAPPVRGFADLHVHQFANLGFGGRAFFGSPAGRADTSMPWCTDVHGPGGAFDVVGTMVRDFSIPGWQGWGHKVGGWYQFDGWPSAIDYTHQAAHRLELKRAWEGGLRLIVMLAVNNAEMCGLVRKADGRSCNDMEAVWYQLDGAKALERELNADGETWYHIVRSAQEARDTIEAGNLAVVLGVEVDTLGNCEANGSCTPGSVRTLADQLYDAGVRHVFPIHFLTNAFGGSALQNPMTHGELRDCTAEGYEYAKNRVFPTLNPVCNAAGLSPLGDVFLHELVSRRMIIDVDHMSIRSQRAALDVAEDAGYPVVAGHTGFFDIAHGDRKSEGAMTAAQLARIRKLGGVIGVITNQGDRLEDVSSWPYASPVVPHTCGKSVETFAQAYVYAVRKGGPGPVAFGTDLNGFAGQPAGRGTPSDTKDVCLGGRTLGTSVNPSTVVEYPFVDFAGVQQDIGSVGGRPFNVNTDGLAHIGMLPDFVEALRKLGIPPADLEPLLTSADGYVRMWERIDARP